MKNQLRFLLKNKQSFIALFVLLVMAFNACSNPAGSKTVDPTTLEYGYVDSNGNITETDSGRTLVVADKKAKAVFYSDNLASDAQRVGFAYEGKTMIFFFEKNQNFPSSIVLSGSGEPINGVFSPYDSATQTYSLTVEQGGDQATLSDVALKKNILTQYKDDPGFSSSQNLRMRNLYIAMQIYKSLDAFLASDNAHQARGTWNTVNNVMQVFFPGPITEIMVGGLGFYVEAKSFMSTSNPITMKDNISGLIESTKLIVSGINILTSQLSFVAVTGITGVPNTFSIGTLGGDYSITLSGTVAPSNATNKIIAWSVKSPGKTGAKIKGDTLSVTAAGTVTVTATIANGKATGKAFTGDFTIIVNDSFVPVTGITDVTTKTSQMSLYLFGYVQPGNATNQGIVWSVKSPGTTGVKYNSRDNTLTVTAPGTVTVTATIANGRAKGTPYTQDFTITFTFVAVTRITDVPTTAPVGRLDLSGTVAPTNATDKNIVWSVKSPGTTGAIMFFDSRLSTSAAGTVIVTATIANGKAPGTPYTQDFSIAIGNSNTFEAVTGITDVPTTASVGSLALSGTVAPYNATNKTIVWSVKSPGTTGAKISGDTLTTTAAGTVKVTATIANGKAVGTPFTQDFSIAVTTAAASKPDIPKNISATPASSSSIIVSWSSVTGATGYYVYRSSSSSGTYYYEGNVTTNSYTDTGLSANATYYYKVSAYNSTGESAQSSSVSAKTSISIPATPTGLSASAASSSSITVSWSAVTGATGYKIYRSSSSYDTYSSVGDVTTTSFTDTGLSANTTYYYKVSAYDSGGESTQSSSVSAKTDKPIPTTPPDISPSLSIWGRTLSLGEVLGATGYYVYRSTSVSGNYNRIATVPVSTGLGCYYQDTDAKLATSYYYKVSAYNSLGEGPLSQYEPNRLLDYPKNVKATLLSNDFWLVTWDSVPGAGWYSVVWSENGFSWYGSSDDFVTTTSRRGGRVGGKYVRVTAGYTFTETGTSVTSGDSDVVSLTN